MHNRLPRRGRRAKRQIFRLDVLKVWVEIVAIAIAGMWAAWNFNFKERLQPKAIPEAASIDLHLNLGAIRNGLLAVEANFVLDNQTPRTTYLLATGYMVLGRKIKPRTPDEPRFVDDVDALFAARQEFERGIAVLYPPPDIIASGAILQNWHLEPKEVVRQTRVFYVPAEKYDEIVLIVKSSIADDPDSVAVRQELLIPGILRHVPLVPVEKANRIEFREMTPSERGRQLPAHHYDLVYASVSASLWGHCDVVEGKPEVQSSSNRMASQPKHTAN